MQQEPNKTVYVILRIDYFQGPNPNIEDIWQYGGKDEQGNEIKEKVYHTRALKVFHDYGSADNERKRLQALQEITEVEYYITGAKLVE